MNILSLFSVGYSFTIIVILIEMDFQPLFDSVRINSNYFIHDLS